MQLSINGEQKTLDDGATVADIVRFFDLTPQRVAVELNEKLVRRTHYAQTRLSAGDRVEIVTLVGGG